MDYNQVSDFITEAIGIMSVDDKPTLVAMLERNGSLNITDESTQEEILDATFKAIQNSPKFRFELTEYLNQKIREAEGI